MYSLAPHVTVDKYSEVSGYSPAAIYNKISTGAWIEGEQWLRAPDGKPLICVEGVAKWVQAGPSKAFGPVRTRRSKSTSGTAAAGAAKGSSSSPLPPT